MTKRTGLDAVTIRGLLDDDALERSAVVANRAMKRDRPAHGADSYQQELRLDPLAFLLGRAVGQGNLRWLDLCCGRGRALIETALMWRQSRLGRRLSLVGVDLDGDFAPGADRLPEVTLVRAALHRFSPRDAFDLITCVHGLRYVGDKLGIVCKFAGTLKDDGSLWAHLDVDHVFDQDGRPLDRAVLDWLERTGCRYYAADRLLICAGRRTLEAPFTYLGADDRHRGRDGGQPAVASFYRAA